MMHTANLPPLSKKRLTEALFLQLRLLGWAAAASEVTREACRAWLESTRHYRNRADQIASWVWRSDKRCGPLERFAGRPVDARRAWVKALSKEACRLLRHPRGALQPFKEGTAEPWQKEGAAFLRRFYEDFRNSGLPAELFRNSTDGPFSGQIFLDAFLRENVHLCVCPACDESSFYAVARGGIRAEIDHFLPKSTYPHFAVHPFNLVPLCHNCNAWLKRDNDPLAEADRRRALEELWLPYREEGLSKRSYLVVSTDEVRSKTRFESIHPREASVLQSWIDSLAPLFDLPARWSERVDMIGEKLFRRMRAYVRDALGRDTYSSIDSAQEAKGLLHELLVVMHDEELGREPDAFAMVWWLAKLITDELESEDYREGPLLRELRHWAKGSNEGREQLRSRGAELRQVVVADRS